MSTYSYHTTESLRQLPQEARYGSSCRRRPENEMSLSLPVPICLFEANADLTNAKD